jgi:hypothetical protein
MEQTYLSKGISIEGTAQSAKGVFFSQKPDRGYATSTYVSAAIQFHANALSSKFLTSTFPRGEIYAFMNRPQVESLLTRYEESVTNWSRLNFFMMCQEEK